MVVVKQVPADRGKVITVRDRACGSRKVVSGEVTRSDHGTRLLARF